MAMQPYSIKQLELSKAKATAMARASKKKKERRSDRKHSPYPPGPANEFENDGSFLDSFKKRMGDYERQRGTDVTSSKAKPEVETSEAGSSKPKPPDPVASKETEVPCYTTQTMYYKDAKEGESSTTRPHYQGIIGKRKTLLKTAELRQMRKKRREELEEQQNAEQKDQKSSAWKSYMAEVKAYEARRCGDTDDHKRPLVK